MTNVIDLKEYQKNRFRKEYEKAYIKLYGHTYANDSFLSKNVRNNPKENKINYLEGARLNG